MTKEQVKERMERFVALLNKESQLKQELLGLELIGDDELALRKSLRRQDEILKEIEALRRDGMLPILDELGAFIAAKRSEVRPGA